MGIGENIKILRERRGLSQLQLGEIVGVSDKAVSTWELGKKIPRMGSIEKMSNYFGVSKSRILDDDDTPDIFSIPDILPIETRKFPLLGNIACGIPIFADENRETYIEAGTNIKADFCLRAKGDSMINARIQDGDIVFIRRQSDVNDGEIAAVLIDDEATLKRVYKMPGRIQLRAENPNYEPMNFTEENCVNVVILGKAVAFQSDVI